MSDKLLTEIVEEIERVLGARVDGDHLIGFVAECLSLVIEPRYDVIKHSFTLKMFVEVYYADEDTADATLIYDESYSVDRDIRKVVYDFLSKFKFRERLG